MVVIVNANIGHKRQAHHITKPQTASVQELFGNVRMLVDLVPPAPPLIDLAGLQDSSLNEARKADTNLNTIQNWQSDAVWFQQLRTLAIGTRQCTAQGAASCNKTAVLEMCNYRLSGSISVSAIIITIILFMMSMDSRGCLGQLAS